MGKNKDVSFTVYSPLKVNSVKNLFHKLSYRPKIIGEPQNKKWKLIIII